jgi:tRNA threonylcarbamoyladenosine biosynthesis protein TsaB
MKLFIDTSDNKKTVVGLGDESIVKPTGPEKSQQVLGLINQILKKNLPRLPCRQTGRQAGKKTLKDLTEIKVETGAGLPAGRQGSFTGLRVGISVANALGWALKIPVNGKKIGELVEPKYEK